MGWRGLGNNPPGGHSLPLNGPHTLGPAAAAGMVKGASVNTLGKATAKLHHWICAHAMQLLCSHSEPRAKPIPISANSSLALVQHGRAGWTHGGRNFRGALCARSLVHSLSPGPWQVHTWIWLLYFAPHSSAVQLLCRLPLQLASLPAELLSNIVQSLAAADTSGDSLLALACTSKALCRGVRGCVHPVQVTVRGGRAREGELQHALAAALQQWRASGSGHRIGRLEVLPAQPGEEAEAGGAAHSAPFLTRLAEQLPPCLTLRLNTAAADTAALQRLCALAGSSLELVVDASLSQPLVLEGLGISQLQLLLREGSVRLRGLPALRALRAGSFPPAVSDRDVGKLQLFLGRGLPFLESVVHIGKHQKHPRGNMLYVLSTPLRLRSLSWTTHMWTASVPPTLQVRARCPPAPAHAVCAHCGGCGSACLLGRELLPS